MNFWYFFPIVSLIGWATVEKPVVASPSITLTATTELTVAQATSITQYLDVSPSDYYFFPLQELVEKYGVNMMYEDGTFQGNRRITRFQFLNFIPPILEQMKKSGIRLMQPVAVPPPAINRILDLQPTDWAFQTIRNLKDEYEVNLMYPDGSFRGNRALIVNDFRSYLNQMLGANLQLSDILQDLPSGTTENTPITRGMCAVILNKALQDAEARGNLFRS